MGIEPCDECCQAPAAKNGLCWGCLSRLKREHELATDDAYYEDDDWPDDDASDRAQSDWESYHHGGDK